jgi:hypothetical protein
MPAPVIEAPAAKIEANAETDERVDAIKAKQQTKEEKRKQKRAQFLQSEYYTLTHSHNALV